jgi:hypothetical protein
MKCFKPECTFLHSTPDRRSPAAQNQAQGQSQPPQQRQHQQRHNHGNHQQQSHTSYPQSNGQAMWQPPAQPQDYYDQYDEGDYMDAEVMIAGDEGDVLAIDAVPVVVNGKTVLKYRVAMAEGQDALFDSYTDAMDFLSMIQGEQGEDDSEDTK